LSALAIACDSEPTRAKKPDRILLWSRCLAGRGCIFDLSREGYSISAGVETRGLADLLVDLLGTLEVRGSISAGVLLPKAFHAERIGAAPNLLTRIDYSADGTVTVKASPRAGSTAHAGYAGAATRHHRPDVRIPLIGAPSRAPQLIVAHAGRF
jgi:hypothetical protein